MAASAESEEPRPDGPVTASMAFPVVGVGASAGGMEAFAQLLQQLPPKPGLALILIMHLDPHHESLLPGILSRSTQMPVVEAGHGMKVEPNRVYVIPPNSLVSLTDGHLQVTPRPLHGPNMPIDHLFRSLSQTQRDQAVGVILSGGGSDGTLGLQEISAEDGITFAQDERTAQQDSMPRSAAASGCVDFVLPPEGIAHELVRLTRDLHVVRPKVPSDLLVHDADGMKRLFGLLRNHTLVDFSQYKHSTINRRIRRRMALRNVTGLDDYLQRLRDEPAELQALYQDLLIRVTSFFRDPAIFQTLQEKVFPRLLQGRTADTPIRIWIAGCATGEEVYSLGIALIESLGDRALNTPVKILATDISESALEKARSGCYVENIALDVSPERLRRFFVKVNGHYRISKTIRDLCVFARHNLVRDPPFSKLDLISCRNVLIYLSLSLQKRVIPTFYYALNPQGYLLLGTSETIGGFTDHFELIEPKSRIYAKRPGAPVPVPFDFDFVRGHTLPATAGKVYTEDKGLLTPLDLQREADRLILSKYGPAGVLVDGRFNILQFRGHTGRYLEPSPGIASMSVLRMAREGLLIELRQALTEAKAENKPVHKENLLIKEGEHFRAVNINVIPLAVPPATGRCYLVLFEEAPPRPVPAVLVEGTPPEPAETEQVGEQYIAQLQQELDSAREYLQSIFEENEATTEELKSAHEELLSSNEELQSTNEELQTAKEEMQSTNEELATVNDELHHRNLELVKVNDDLANLFNGIHIPIVMVGRDQRIRRMTPLAEKVFNLIPTDVGRPIGDIRPTLDIPHLDQLIAEVIATLKVKELEVPNRQGRWFSLRIRPYVTLDNRVDGASIVAVDIDAVKHSLGNLKQARDCADAIVDMVTQPLVLLDQELRIRRANPAFHAVIGTQADETLGQSFLRLSHGQWNQSNLEARLRQTLEKGIGFRDVPLEVELPAGRRRLLLHVQRVTWPDNQAPFLLVALEEKPKAPESER